MNRCCFNSCSMQFNFLVFLPWNRRGAYVNLKKPAPEKTAVFLDHVHLWLHLCLMGLQPRFSDGTVNSVYRQRFLDVLLSPWGFLDSIMAAFNAAMPEDPKITDIQYWLSASSLVHRDSSRWSESLDIMYCRWWDSPSLHSFMLKNIILKFFHNL